MEEKDNKLHLKPDNDKFLDPNNVVSNTECTGLIQTPPLTEDEAESYKEIYDLPVPKDKAGNDSGGQAG
jgi:hypothetical protein